MTGRRIETSLTKSFPSQINSQEFQTVLRGSSVFGFYGKAHVIHLVPKMRILN